MRLKFNFYFLLFTLIIPKSGIASPELPSVKLRCTGYAYIDNQRYELNDGFIDLDKNKASVRGFGVPDGAYEVIPKSVRDDFLAIKNINNPLLIGSINRLSGRTNFAENSASVNIRDGKMYFIGECLKAKKLF